MDGQLIALLLFVAVVAALTGALLLLPRLLAPRNPSLEKARPFECGHLVQEVKRGRFDLKFYLIALFFVLFDVEMAFLFPWAVVVRELGAFAYVEMLVFIGILLAGYVYLWKKGGLEWQ
ncbi:MAG: NADH-quinone oxidoreductase subunit A [Acidobacteria bacterium]|nr:NADH-quinone oxidoreductase subunit A [Acidobacteriota bacterium]